MKSLSDMIKDAKNAETSGIDTEGPLNSSFVDFMLEYDDLLEQHKIGEGDKRSLPSWLGILLAAAHANGASSALGIMKYGYPILDNEGNYVDTIFYSLEELMIEAREIISPGCNTELLESLRELEEADAELSMSGGQESADGDEDFDGDDSEDSVNVNTPKTILH